MALGCARRGLGYGGYTHRAIDSFDSLPSDRVPARQVQDEAAIEALRVIMGRRHFR